MTSLDRGCVQAVLFDLDGTLIDTDDRMVLRLAAFLRPLMRKSPEQLARRIVMAAETPSNRLLWAIDGLGIDALIGPIANGLHKLRGEAAIDGFRLIEGVRPMLGQLAAHYPLALVTSREQRSTQALMAAHGLDPFFRAVATARTCRRSKPHPAPVLWAAEQLSVNPQACLMVGDTTPDIRSAVAAGAQAVGVLCGFGEADELLAAGAGRILESTAELADALL